METETNQNVSRKIKNKSKQKNANYIDTKGHNLNKKRHSLTYIILHVNAMHQINGV